MTQAPATPELVERLEDAAERHPGPPDGINRLLKQAADALEAQQARIAELERDLDGAATDAFCGHDRAESAEALADRYEKALRDIADDPYQFGQRVQRMKGIARQALSSSQGRHEGGEG